MSHNGRAGVESRLLEVPIRDTSDESPASQQSA